MLSKKCHLGITVVLTVIAMLTTSAAFAATERVLHNFGNNNDGKNAQSGVIFDAHGNLYGTTVRGGAYTNGTAFELVARQGGGFTEKVLHSFGNGSDGAQPLGGLLMSPQGILVGTTSAGGANGAGTVFALVPKAGGGWAEKILYSFGGRPDGSGPGSALISDASGNLYGTTGAGGAFGMGTVFELVRRSGGGWAEKVLYSFGSSVTDGFGPAGNLVFGPGGSLFGVTGEGGQMFCNLNCGTVYQLTPTNGVWTETIIHVFGTGSDGYQPAAGVIIDSWGNLYGTTFYGGVLTAYGLTGGPGIAYELTPQSDGTWTETILYNFGGNAGDGTNPDSGLLFDSAGNLYGETAQGGSGGGAGTVFKLTDVKTQGWTETVLHSFPASIQDGVSPMGGLVPDSTGNLYGVTNSGGTYGGGTVFGIRP